MQRIYTVIVAAVVLTAFPCLAIAQETADWSGWWGGISAGGAVSNLSGSGLTNGKSFCISDVSGPGATASCQVTGDTIDLHTRIERDNGYIASNHAFDLADKTIYMNADTTHAPEGAFFNTIDSYSISPDTTKYLSYSAMRLSDGSGDSTAISFGSLDAFESISHSFDFSSANAAVGGHLRRDWQFDSNFVIGAEVESQFFFGNGKAWSGMIMQSTNFEYLGPSVTASQSNEIKSEGLGSLRLRAGYAHGRVLSYLTAGLGIGRFEAKMEKSISGLEYPNIPDMRTSETISKWAIGPVVGIGASAMLTDRVAVTGEALYFTFDDKFVFSDSQSMGIDSVFSAMAKISLKLN